MARPFKTDRPIQWRCNIPESVAAKVELRLWDPLRHTVRLGARSELVTHLLRGWLEDGEEKTNPD